MQILLTNILGYKSYGALHLRGGDKNVIQKYPNITVRCTLAVRMKI
jgi:hypothetical protein